MLPRWSRLQPPTSIPGAPLTTSGSQERGKKEASCVWEHVRSRVAVIKSLSQSLLAAL